MAFDRKKFSRDGARYRQLRDEMKPLKASLDARLPAARAAGMTVAEIMADTGLADSWVRKLAPAVGEAAPGADAETKPA